VLRPNRTRAAAAARPTPAHVFSPMWWLITAGRHEQRARAIALHQIEADDVDVEALRSVERGHVQMDVPH